VSGPPELAGGGVEPTHFARGLAYGAVVGHARSHYDGVAHNCGRRGLFVIGETGRRKAESGPQVDNAVIAEAGDGLATRGVECDQVCVDLAVTDRAIENGCGGFLERSDQWIRDDPEDPAAVRSTYPLNYAVEELSMRTLLRSWVSGPISANVRSGSRIGCQLPFDSLQSFVTFATVSVPMAGPTQQYLLIGEAAQLLGVSQGTLRNWGWQGKIRTHRHPINRYRLYRREDIEGLVAEIHASAETGNAAGSDRRTVASGGRRGT
jgi:MerR family transcriptional regulator, copper efflux regulator